VLGETDEKTEAPAPDSKEFDGLCFEIGKFLDLSPPD
jgi:hypothetical protein